MSTDTHLDDAPVPADTGLRDTLLTQAKEALNGTGEAIGSAFDGVVEAARKNPVAAAAIAAGAAAAVAGAAFGIGKLLDTDDAQ